jgi:outer membrane protein insertion porin family
MLTKTCRQLIFLIIALTAFCGISFSEELSLPTILDLVEGTREARTPSSPPKKTGKEILVTSIEVKGEKSAPEKEILDAIFSKVGEPLIKQKVEADIKAIYALGYFADVSADTAPYKNGEKIIFLVSENPTITMITFEGNSALSAEQLTSSMETRVGEILNFVKLREDIKRVNEYYHTTGYLLARVIDVATDDEGVLRVNVIEGVIEEIKIEGNDNTQDYVIRRELNTKPGAVLNDKKLAKDLRRVFNLGFFSEVNPTFQPGEEPDKVVLVVRVKEQRSSTINLGGGYGEREGWFGFVDLSLNNLFGTGQGLLIRGQTGTELQTYQFRYYNPWVLEDQFGDHFSFTYKRWYTVGSDFYFLGQNEIHNGWDVAFGKPFYDVWRLSWSLGSEWVGPYGDSSFEAYDTWTTGLALSYDTRDFRMNPTEGVFHTVSTKWGWKYANKVTQYMKYGLDLNFFVPLADRQVLALHSGAGLGVGDVPIGDLYWVGSANTVRGYYPSDAKLGTKKLLFNVEYRYTFNEVFQGVVFYDFGNAWYSGAPNFGEFISGKGFGIRLNTPLGPIRLDYGLAGDKGFGEGVIHFSIGQAF